VHGAARDGEGDEPVVDGGQVAEALAEERGAARAERRVVEQLERVDGRLRDAEELAVGGQVLARGPNGVGGEAGRERAVVRRQRLRRAEAAPADVNVARRGELLLVRRGRLAALALVEVPPAAFLTLNAGLAVLSCGAAGARGGRDDSRHGERDHDGDHAKTWLCVHRFPPPGRF
jgi:hypothetical protein